MSVTFPPKITAAQLKSIARLCGKTRSGTKAAITDRIVDDLAGFKPLAPGTRILSIDLGIRNLAYSLLEVPEIHEAQPLSKTKKRSKVQEAPSPGAVVPILHAWDRLALVPKAPPPPTVSRKKKTKGKTEPEPEPLPTDDTIEGIKKRRTRKKAAPGPTDDGEIITALDGEIKGEQGDPSIALPAEDFSPKRLSLAALHLILYRLLPLKPDIVTLEQQRFRSMGGSGVFEWTLRVNSLEAMLYAVFTTLQELGQWPHGRLESVVARNVLEFMDAQEGLGEADIWDKEKKGDNKKIKKDIVGRMLRDGDGVKLMGTEGALGEMVTDYLDKWGRDGKRGKSASSLKKLDDLADCLLQGIAFIRWQDNKRKLLEGGVKALEDQCT